MSIKRNQLVAFSNLFSADSGTANYEDTPWTDRAPEEINMCHDMMIRDFDCSAFDLFRPVRDPRLVASDLSETRTTLTGSGLMEDLSCPICMGICKEVMVVKDCSHRFCGECIQKWLRSGHQVCPQCRSKIPSRRALRHDDIFDAIIERLFSDVEKFERERAQITAEMNRKFSQPPRDQSSLNEQKPSPNRTTAADPPRMQRNYNPSQITTGARRGRPPKYLQQSMRDLSLAAAPVPTSVLQRSETARSKMSAKNRTRSQKSDSISESSAPMADSQSLMGNESELDQMESSSSPSFDALDEDDDDDDDDDEDDEDDDDDVSLSSSGRAVRFHGSSRSSKRALSAREKRLEGVGTAGVTQLTQQSTRWDGVSANSSSIEVFLVCLNQNLTPAVCSMARELSKRPIKFAISSTTRDVAMFLAERIVQDVLGSYDLQTLISELSFVREGEFWPATSGVPLPEICRAVTESLGPTVLRYVLSDRLFAVCERASMALGSGGGARPE